MNKILVTLALTLVAAPAFASTKKAPKDSAYGVVRTLCMGADLPGTKPGNGCEAWLDSAGKSIKLNGNFTKIAKYNGKMVEVKGVSECLNGANCAFLVSSIKAVAAEPLTPPTATGSAVTRGAQTQGGSVAATPSSTSGGGTTR